MSARNYGLSSRSQLGGNDSATGPHHAPYTTQRNLSNLPPLPAQSLREAPILDCDREIGATVFVIGCFAAVPIALYVFIKLFE